MRTSLVNRSSLREQLLEALRDEMVTGRMPPGRHYTAKEIAELYGVSATPVREAMVELAADGMLEAAHLRGFRVRVIARTEFEEILQARRALLHGQIGPGAAGPLPPLTESSLAAVRRRGQAALGAARNGGLDVLIVSDLRFWREFSVLFGNQHITRFLDKLRTLGWMYMVRFLREAEDGGFWLRQLELVDRTGDGDWPAVWELLEDYRRTVSAIADRFDGTAAGDGPAAP